MLQARRISWYLIDRFYEKVMLWVRSIPLLVYNVYESFKMCPDDHILRKRNMWRAKLKHLRHVTEALKATLRYFSVVVIV